MLNKQSVLYFIVIAFLTIGGLAQGYFTDAGLLVITSVLLLAAVIYAWTSREWSVSWLVLGVVLYASAYGITLLHAVDLEHAIIEFARVVLLVPLAILLLKLDESKLHAVHTGFTRIAALIAAIGIVFGMERQGRLESTIEYANALAVMLLVAMIIAILEYLRAGRIRELVVTAVCFGGLLLTQSRSVWVLWILAAGMSIILFKEMRRWKTLAAVAAAHAAGFIIACIYKQDLLFLINRVQSIQPETSEYRIRLTYWQDSVGMLKHYWWQGTGGGGWSLLQQDYQSKPYYVKFIHNHYLQTILDAGVLGIGALLGIIGLFVWSAARLLRRGAEEEKFWGKGMLLAAGVLLLHAGFDFDLTFPIVSGLLLVLFVRTARSVPPAFHIRRSSAKVMILLGALLVFGLSVWLSLGYQQKGAAVRIRDQGAAVDALSRFESAVGILPWAHTIHYEFGKAYVHAGNRSQNLQDYRRAQEEVEKAAKLQPKETLYQELLEELNLPIRSPLVSAKQM